MKRNILLVVIFIVFLFICFYFKNNGFILSSYQGFIIEGDTIIRYDNYGGNVVIPSSINGVVIKKIGAYAFSDKDIDSVVIPDSVVEVGAYAFMNNNLTSISIPNNVVRIGEGAFMHNFIESLSLESKVELGNACFNNNLLDNSNSFFYNKYNSNELISYGGKLKGNIVLPNEVEVIGEKAFMDTGIVSISLSDNISSIKSNAFKGNNLVEVYLSSNINEISIDAFSDNDYLMEIIVDNHYNSILNGPWGAEFSEVFWTKK